MIIAIPAIVSTIVTLVLTIRVSKQVHEVHLSLNSRFEEWMQMAQKAFFAQGYKAAQESEGPSFNGHVKV